MAVGAATAEGLESDKASLQESVQAAKYTCEALEATISEHASAREQEAATTLELRTRTVVLQQDVRQREADARELVQRLQVGATRHQFFFLLVLGKNLYSSRFRQEGMILGYPWSSPATVLCPHMSSDKFSNV